MPSSSSSDWQLGHVPVDQLAAAISQVGFVPIVGQPPRSGPPPHSYPLTLGSLPRFGSSQAPKKRFDALVANATSALAANPHALAANEIRRPDAILANAASAALAVWEPTDAVVANAVSDALVANAAPAGLAADFAFKVFPFEADVTNNIEYEDTREDTHNGKKRKRSAAGEGIHIVVETGAWEDIWDFEVQEDDKIIDVKKQVFKRMGGPSVGEMVLSYNGIILINTFTVRDYDVTKSSRFYLTWADDDE